MFACPLDGGAARAVAPDANEPLTGVRPAARVSQRNAGMTSVANSSAERSVSANVMSPKANSSEK